MADAEGLNPSDPLGSCGFESRPGHRKTRLVFRGRVRRAVGPDTTGGRVPGRVRDAGSRAEGGFDHRRGGRGAFPERTRAGRSAARAPVAAHWAHADAWCDRQPLGDRCVVRLLRWARRNTVLRRCVHFHHHAGYHGDGVANPRSRSRSRAQPARRRRHPSEGARRRSRASDRCPDCGVDATSPESAATRGLLDGAAAGRGARGSATQMR